MFFSKHRVAALGFAASMGLALSGGAQAGSYNAASDFSPTSNPNTPWTYLYNGTVLPTPASGGTYNIWWSGQPVPNSIYVGRAISGSTSEGTVQYGTDYLTMDPESQTVDVRFTAPTAGTYNISGEFFGADNQTNCGSSCAAHPVLITEGGSNTIFGPQSIATYLQTYTFDLSETLSAGETVDFLAETGTDGGCTYCNLSTGLEATISSTPLPSTWTMLLIGLAGLGFVGYRHGKKSTLALVA
jgi:hypothetical protein